jgi:surface carbohydrate biosynthesis protein
MRWLRSAWRYVMGARWQILPPRRSPVLIFDGMNLYLLAPALEPWSPEVLYLRGEVLNLYCLIRSLFRGGRRMDAYIDSYVDAVHPQLIVTLFDNDRRFYALSARHPAIKTLFIQNGWRSYYADVFEALDHLKLEERKSAQVDYMLVFGRHVGEEYARHIKGLIVPCGSYKNNRIHRSGMRQPEVLAFISQYNDGGIVVNDKSIPHDEFFRKPDQLVLGVLLEYARVNGKQLVIVPRYRRVQMPERTKEVVYYQELLGTEVSFLEPDTDNPSYAAVDVAGVSVAIDTTLGYESLARGNRTAMFSVRGTLCGLKGLNFGWPFNAPDTGFFWTNRADPAGFTRILDRLYATTDEDWQAELTACRVSDLMCSDPDNSILQRILHGELGVPT